MLKEKQVREELQQEVADEVAPTVNPSLSHAHLANRRPIGHQVHYVGRIDCYATPYTRSALVQGGLSPSDGALFLNILS